MPDFVHDGIKFHYEIKGNGTPLIFLHGLGGSIMQPNNLLDPIEGVKFVFLDQRGHGETVLGNASEMTFDNMAKDVIALADHLGFNTFCVGGISMGAAVSVRLALNFPERVDALILCRIAFGDSAMDDIHIEWNSKLAKYLRVGDLNEFLSSDIFSEINAEHPDTASIFKSAFYDKASLEYPEKYEIIPTQAALCSFEELERLSCRTLICSDKYCPIHKYALGVKYSEHIANCTFSETAPKSAVPKEYRKDINTALSAFLR